MLAGRLELHQIDHIDDAHLRLGWAMRRISTAASVSIVGTSPQQAITTSGSLPRSLLAHSQMPMPAVQCRMAASISSHWGAGCLPATTTFTQPRLQAMIGHRQQRVRIRRQIDTNDSAFIHHMVDESRILMAEPVVVPAATCEVSR